MKNKNKEAEIFFVRQFIQVMEDRKKTNIVNISDILYLRKLAAQIWGDKPRRGAAWVREQVKYRR